MMKRTRTGNDGRAQLRMLLVIVMVLMCVQTAQAEELPELHAKLSNIKELVEAKAALVLHPHTSLRLRHLNIIPILTKHGNLVIRSPWLQFYQPMRKGELMSRTDHSDISAAESDQQQPVTDTKGSGISPLPRSGSLVDETADIPETCGDSSLSLPEVTSPKELGSYIHSVRKRNGYTLEKAALKLNVSKSMLSRIENGSQGFSAQLSGAIAKLYTINPQTLELAASSLQRKRPSSTHRQSTNRELHGNVVEQFTQLAKELAADLIAGRLSATAADKIVSSWEDAFQVAQTFRSNHALPPAQPLDTDCGINQGGCDHGRAQPSRA